MSKITEIFRQYGPEYLEKYPNMPLQHEKVLHAIINCRSGEYGAAFYQCEGCGKRHRVDRSCGNRHCPQCQYHKSQRWLETQLNKALPVEYSMLTFTVPKEIRFFCRANQKAAYSALFKASSSAIRATVKNPRFVGTNLPGFTGVLHTWGRRLPYHPHIHYIMPAGGLSDDRRKWIAARNSFYLPVRALSKLYRAKFKAEMERLDLLSKIDSSVWSKKWVVNIQAVGDPEASLKYLAPYVFRVAISNSRIIGIANRIVTFTYRKTGSRRLRKISLEVLTFISHFLQHVLPSGFAKVRHYGFMNANCATPLSKIRNMVIICFKLMSLLLSDSVQESQSRIEHQPFCPGCGGQLIYLFSIIPGRGYRGGPG